MLWVSWFRSHEVRVSYISQKCPIYLKSVGKSKALAATLSDIEPKDDSNNEDDRILNAFTITVNPIDGIVEDVDEEEELVESKFEKIDDQDDILQPMRNCTKFLKSMRNSIGWSPRNSVMWNLIMKNCPQSLMRLIRLLEH